MIQLSKFGASDDNPEFHSHAIARADSFQAQTIGSTDKSSFLQRKRVERNRQHIAGYQAASVHDDHRRDAKLGQGSQQPVSARLAAAGEQTSPSSSTLRRRELTNSVPPRASGSVGLKPIQRPTFTEPTRRYNPYS